MFLLMLLALQPTAPVQAQDVAPRQIFEDGKRAYNLGRYDEAAQLFADCYAKTGDATLLFNVGQSQWLAGRNDLAIAAYRGYLREKPVAENREAVENKIRVLQRAQAQQQRKGMSVARPKPVDASQAAAMAEKEPLTDPFAPAKTVVARSTSLHPQPPLPTHAMPVLSSPSPAPMSAPARPQRRTHAGWYASGATGVLALAAIGTGLSATGLYEDLRGSCGATEAGCSTAQINSVQNRVLAANLLWGATGIAALTTGVLFYLDLNRNSARATLALVF